MGEKLTPGMMGGMALIAAGLVVINLKFNSETGPRNDNG